MKRIIKQLLVSACAGLALVLPACQKDASEAEVPQWTAKESTLVGTLKESHYTPNEFVDALGSPSMTGMLEQVAPHYGMQVEYRNEEARTLRFYFVWQPDEELDAALERLNLFESVNITKEGNTIVVE